MRSIMVISSRILRKQVWVNDGLTLYSGAAHQFSTLKLLDWRKSGLLHTGILWFGPWKRAGGHQPSGEQ